MTAAGEATRLHVAGPAPYDVLVGREVVAEVAAPLAGAQTVALVHPAGLPEPADAVAATLAGTGRSVTRLPVPDGEDAKDLRVAAALWDGFARAGLTRQDAVVAVGGGATTDVAGFAAATWLRGVRLVLVPTTLLGMVDAAVGGKTAVNTAAGKNLVGAFHPPAGVVCDLRWLRTLPPAELASGLAEVVKTGFIADPVILDLLSSPAPDEGVLRELVERSVRVKADVVARDLREAGPREVLNYGHTLGHAIERVEGFRVRHGEAVSVGMVFAAELARLSGRLDEETVRRHREVLAAAGLPLTYRAQAWPQLLEAMRMDKKARGRRLRFVVLDGVGRPGILDDPDPALLDAAYRKVSG